MALLMVFFLGHSGPARAAEQVTLEGKIEGAACVHFNKVCPADEAHLAMENDFVLLMNDGSHYFLPNLSRLTKARYATETVRVTGEKKDHEIWVEKLAVEEAGKFRSVWTWKEQQEQFRLGGG